MALIPFYLFENSREPLSGPLDSASFPSPGDKAGGSVSQEIIGQSFGTTFNKGKSMASVLLQRHCNTLLSICPVFTAEVTLCIFKSRGKFSSSKQNKPNSGATLEPLQLSRAELKSPLAWTFILSDSSQAFAFLWTWTMLSFLWGMSEPKEINFCIQKEESNITLNGSISTRFPDTKCISALHIWASFLSFRCLNWKVTGSIFKGKKYCVWNLCM